MADERGTRLNEGLDKWLQVTDTDKLETWDGTDKMAAIKESLGINDNVAISDIVDDLNSTDVDKPLSANQGKVLQDSKEDADNTILKEGDVEDSLNSTSVTKPLSANQGKELQDNKEPADNTILKEGDVENTLTSTSTTKPLSANQGKQLNDDKASLSGGADANFTLMPQVGGNPAIASGSNSDGEFVRFADGTQICSFNMSRGGLFSNTSANRTWTFPIPFSNGASISLNTAFGNFVSGSDGAEDGQGYSNTLFTAFAPATSYSFKWVWSGSGTVNSVRASLTAKGRWY